MKRSLYKIQYLPSSDLCVDVFETSNRRKFYNMFVYLTSNRPKAHIRCLMLFGDTYREILT